MKEVRAGPADWVVKAASTKQQFQQRLVLPAWFFTAESGLTQMINDDKHLAEPSGER